MRIKYFTNLSIDAGYGTQIQISRGFRASDYGIRRLQVNTIGSIKGRAIIARQKGNYRVDEHGVPHSVLPFTGEVHEVWSTVMRTKGRSMYVSISYLSSLITQNSTICQQRVSRKSHASSINFTTGKIIS